MVSSTLLCTHKVVHVKESTNTARFSKDVLCVGEHPRIGALDVCPFIPVSNVSMEECVQCSRQFGKALAREMGVPVFLYEQAQDKEYRKSLTQIRKGNYEGLEEKVLYGWLDMQFGDSCPNCT